MDAQNLLTSCRQLRTSVLRCLPQKILPRSLQIRWNRAAVVSRQLAQDAERVLPFPDSSSFQYVCVFGWGWSMHNRTACCIVGLAQNSCCYKLWLFLQALDMQVRVRQYLVYDRLKMAPQTFTGTWVYMAGLDDTLCRSGWRWPILQLVFLFLQAVEYVYMAGQENLQYRHSTKQPVDQHVLFLQAVEYTWQGRKIHRIGLAQNNLLFNMSCFCRHWSTQGGARRSMTWDWLKQLSPSPQPITILKWKSSTQEKAAT